MAGVFLEGEAGQSGCQSLSAVLKIGKQSDGDASLQAGWEVVTTQERFCAWRQSKSYTVI